MQSALSKYHEKIQSGQIDPAVRWDGQSCGILLDPVRDDVPLEKIAFHAWQLAQGPFDLATEDREWVLLPLTGHFRVETPLDEFTSTRSGGPFAELPQRSNAQAVYLPRDCRFRLEGDGEMVAFTAPAFEDRKPVFVAPGDKPNLSRGSGVWRRDVVTLITPDDVSTNLVVGETYSPPGLWSGTPLHVHDLDDLDAGQSDHEEIYYHVMRLKEGQWGPYSVQLLFDEKGLDQSYLVRDRTAFAIPGAAHPVVAGPASDHLYLWGLSAEKSSPLGMKDIEEFAYMKKVGEILDHYETRREKTPIPEN